MEAARKQLGRDLVAAVPEVDTRLATLSTQMSQTIAEQRSRLPEVDGIGPVVAARLLGRTGRASRFPTASAFAATPGSPRSRWLAPTAPATDYPAVGTAS